MGLETLIEAFGEEVVGTLSGLPPGTVTAAKAAGVLASTASSTSSTGNQASNTVKKNSSQLSRDQEKVVNIAVARLAEQIGRDHRRIRPKTAVRTAMNILIFNRLLYKPSFARRNFKIALFGSSGELRSMMGRTLRDARRHL